MNNDSETARHKERSDGIPNDTLQVNTYTHEIEYENGCLLPAFRVVEQRASIHNLLFKKAELNGLVSRVESSHHHEPMAVADMFQF